MYWASATHTFVWIFYIFVLRLIYSCMVGRFVLTMAIFLLSVLSMLNLLYRPEKMRNFLVFFLSRYEFYLMASSLNRLHF